MKIRSKKMLTTLVAAFMVVVLAGSAFAFGTGALQFNGTVNIDTALDVQIHQFVQPVGLDATIAPDRKSVTFRLGDIQPGEELRAAFTLFNEGTVPARLDILTDLPATFVDVLDIRLYRQIDGWNNFGRPWDADHAIIVPRNTVSGAPFNYLPSVVLDVRVTFCKAALYAFEGMYIDEEIEFTIELQYTWYRGPIN